MPQFTSNERDLIVRGLTQLLGPTPEEDSEATALSESDRDRISSLVEKLTNTQTIPFSSKEAAAKLRSLGVEILQFSWMRGGKKKAAERGKKELQQNTSPLATAKGLLETVMGHVSRWKEAGCRMLVDVFLLCVAKVLSNEEEWICLVPEWTIDEVTIDNQSFRGIVDYLMTKSDRESSRIILLNQNDILKRSSTLEGGYVNIFEAKTQESLLDGVPQCVLGMASWCQFSGQRSMRGAVTTGTDWIFLIYHHGGDDDDDQRLYYAESEIITLNSGKDAVEIILALLIDWAENGDVAEPECYFKPPRQVKLISTRRQKRRARGDDGDAEVSEVHDETTAGGNKGSITTRSSDGNAGGSQVTTRGAIGSSREVTGAGPGTQSSKRRRRS